MPFVTTGLAAAIADAKAGLAATTDFRNLTAQEAYVRGYARGAGYALPLDHTTLGALVTLLNTVPNFGDAVALQQAEDAATATDAANDATRSTANTADEAAETAAAAAITSSGF